MTRAETVAESCKDIENHELLTELRRRGLAIAAFGLFDVLSWHLASAVDWSEAAQDRAADWIDANRDNFEESMVRGGNEYLDSAPDRIVADEEES